MNLSKRKIPYSEDMVDVSSLSYVSLYSLARILTSTILHYLLAPSLLKSILEIQVAKKKKPWIISFFFSRGGGGGVGYLYFQY